MDWIREENYEEVMKSVVEPFVTSRMETDIFTGFLRKVSIMNISKMTIPREL